MGSIQAPQLPTYGLGLLSVGMSTTQPPAWPAHPWKSLHTGMAMWAQHTCVSATGFNKEQERAPLHPKGCLSMGHTRPKSSKRERMREDG